MKNKKFILLLTPALFSLSCSKNAIYIEKDSTIKLNYLYTYYTNSNSVFAFKEKYQFKQSEQDSYKITNSFDVKESTIKDISFDKSLIVDCWLSFGGWLASTVLGEDTMIYGFSGKAKLEVSSGTLPANSYISFTYNPKLVKGEETICEGNMTITLKTT